jgi:hypothetical protein
MGAAVATLPSAGTLQALTEAAVACREERPALAAELWAPAVQLAQQMTSQLSAYDLDGDQLVAYEAGHNPLSREERLSLAKARLRPEEEDAIMGRHRYEIRDISWKESVLWRKVRHFPRLRDAVWWAESLTAPVLVLVVDDLHLRPLWDPRSPGLTWDLSNPPILDLPDLMWHSWCKVQLPTAAILADFAKDSMQLAEGVQRREEHRTARLRSGLERSEEALDALAV